MNKVFDNFLRRIEAFFVYQLCSIIALISPDIIEKIMLESSKDILNRDTL